MDCLSGLSLSNETDMDFREMQLFQIFFLPEAEPFRGGTGKATLSVREMRILVIADRQVTTDLSSNVISWSSMVWHTNQLQINITPVTAGQWHYDL